jgi:hypothetical protein
MLDRFTREQLQGGRARHQADRVSIIAPGVWDQWPAARGVEHRHYVASPSEHAEWKAATDELPEAGQVWRYTVVFLCPPVCYPEADDLVQDEEYPEPFRHLAQRVEVVPLGGDHTGRAHYRLHDDCREMRALLFDQARCRLRLVKRQHLHVISAIRSKTQRRRSRNRS